MLEKPNLQLGQFWLTSFKVKLKTVGTLDKTNENFWTDHLSRLSLVQLSYPRFVRLSLASILSILTLLTRTSITAEFRTTLVL